VDQLPEDMGQTASLVIQSSYKVLQQWGGILQDLNLNKRNGINELIKPSSYLYFIAGQSVDRPKTFANMLM
jgi:hypothetical protein